MRAGLLPRLLYPNPPAILSARCLFSTTTTRPSDPVGQEQQQQRSEEQQALDQTSPLIYPASPSQQHTDLSSFLSYAARTNLSPNSTVYIGTHFEYTALNALASYGFSLRRVGGSSDYGIDLLGTWSLPGLLPRPLRVLAQCKAVQRPGPHLVRELEGASVGAPAGWRGSSGVLGLLVTERAATKGIRDALARSKWPMGFVACSRAGKVEQVLWNERAQGEGLEGVLVGKRYTATGEREVALSWNGGSLPLAEGAGVER